MTEDEITRRRLDRAGRETVTLAPGGQPETIAAVLARLDERTLNILGQLAMVQGSQQTHTGLIAKLEEHAGGVNAWSKVFALGYSASFVAVSLGALMGGLAAVAVAGRFVGVW
jgi:hypothetical protein